MFCHDDVEIVDSGSSYKNNIEKHSPSKSHSIFFTFIPEKGKNIRKRENIELKNNSITLKFIHAISTTTPLMFIIIKSCKNKNLMTKRYVSTTPVGWSSRVSDSSISRLRLFYSTFVFFHSY